VSPKYCVLILTKNEERSIAAVIRGVRRVFRNYMNKNVTVVLADDSSDRTATIGKELGAHVIKGSGRGLGVAYSLGLKECLRFKPDRILSLDGDGQADLSEISALITAMNRTGADLVTGSRFLESDAIDYDYPVLNRIGTFLLSSYLTVMTRQRFTDSHGGLRLISRRLAEAQKIFGHHTYVQESILDSVAKGFRVVEIPSRWQRRTQGHSKVVASVPRYIRRTLPYLVLRMFRRAAP
jgi:glycosyltransferase involved in cell wall biosynthesis